jgi:hypothetical protein
MTTKTADPRMVTCFSKSKYRIPDGLRIADDNYERQEGEFFFNIMTPEDGDKRIVWSVKNIGEINDAKKMFNELIAKGMVPYVIKQGKRSSEVMREFDSLAGEVMMADVVMVPQKAIVGG